MIIAELAKYMEEMLPDVHADNLRFKACPKEFLIDMGYREVRQINGYWYGLYRMMYSVALYCKLDASGNAGGRLCFDTWANAALWLKEWDGVQTPTKQDGLKADKRV